jgi:acetate kinase
LDIDDVANEAGGPLITKAGGKTSAWMIPTDEDLMIARHTWRLVSSKVREPSNDGADVPAMPRNG